MKVSGTSGRVSGELHKGVLSDMIVRNVRLGMPEYNRLLEIEELAGEMAKILKEVRKEFGGGFGSGYSAIVDHEFICKIEDTLTSAKALLEK